MKKNTETVDIRPYTRQFYRGNRLRFFLFLVQTAAFVAGDLGISWILQQIIDLVSGADTGFTLGQLALITAGAAAMVAIAFICCYFSKPRFIARAMEQYKDYVFRQISKKSISAFSGENTSLYVSALSNDTAVIENSYLSNIFSLIRESVMFVAALAMMFSYSPLLTFISVGLSLLPIIASILAGNRAAIAEQKVSDCNESYMSTLRDSLEGFPVIKSFRAEARMWRIFAQSVRQVANAREKRLKIGIFIELMSALANIAVQMGVFLAGAFLALSGRGVTAGTVLVFVQLLNYVLSPIGQVPQYLAGIRSSRALIRKVAAALEENVREEGGISKNVLTDGIRAEGLTYAYGPGKPVLRDVSFAFDAGKSYAVVGASGSGKSTLLNLLMASSHGYDGSIRYDNAELKELRSESLYEMVSVVQQNVFIFNASIRDNITMFSDFPGEEVDRAIRLSGLSALIAERGEGYLCGENGSGLSGGEKQRISIARSLLKKSQVLLVDEATAALDAQTAFQVSGAILDLEGLTRIVVTHALEEALLRRYDCILTLKNGCITESGTFDELMGRKGYFYSLFTVSQ